MRIAPFIKLIGRQKPHDLSREQAFELMGLILDDLATDYEIGAFCMAMRIKGETAQELAGFLDAVHGRIHRFTAASNTPVVVIPSYNGARRLPLLTPLLSGLLAQAGVAVITHGMATESSRVTVFDVIALLGHHPTTQIQTIEAGQQLFVPTCVLSTGLQKLLDVRRSIGLRNTAHSVVKLMNPTNTNALIVGSYTHPYYLETMKQAWSLVPTRGLLLRGTEGESVADARRTPLMEAIINGETHALEPAQTGSLRQMADIPHSINPVETAAYIQAVLSGQLEPPASINAQVQVILRALQL